VTAQLSSTDVRQSALSGLDPAADARAKDILASCALWFRTWPADDSRSYDGAGSCSVTVGLTPFELGLVNKKPDLRGQIDEAIKQAVARAGAQCHATTFEWARDEGSTGPAPDGPWDGSYPRLDAAVILQAMKEFLNGRGEKDAAQGLEGASAELAKRRHKTVVTIRQQEPGAQALRRVRKKLVIAASGLLYGIFDTKVVVRSG
jgi:hypothetical protein